MQQFPCPFCDVRPEPEFLFVSEAGKIRPQPAAEVNAQLWSTYLNEAKNLKGSVREIWQHLPCGEVFVMARDSTTMEVLSVTSLRKEPRA